MRIIISESQYKTLNEQVLLGTGLGLFPHTTKIITKYPHEFNAIAGIASAFIPVVGPFISAGIGALDASMYYKEGDKTNAAISGIFSLIPFLGKIPGVKEVGSSVWKTIASKLASGTKLSQVEIEVARQVAENASSIQTLLGSASKKLSPLVKQITELKPAYISRYGQDAYEKLMRDFISGVSVQN